MYWVLDRNWGRTMLGSFSISMLLNGFLKATFCIYRPWMLNSRIEPYGNAKKTATGYSFPSGHTMCAVPTYGGYGIWFWNRNRLIAILNFIFIALVMFSRMYLGCHQPQDVIVGLIMGFFPLYLADKIEKWTAGGEKRDLYAFAGATLICIFLAVYYAVKSYPLDYSADGTLIADPTVLTYDCCEGLGAVFVFYAVRIYEIRKGFAFDREMRWKDRFIVGTFGIIPIYLWTEVVIPLMESWNPYIANLAEYSGQIVIIMILMPWVMKKVHNSGILNKNEMNPLP